MSTAAHSQQPALQQRSLRYYGELLCRQSAWAGKLVVADFDHSSASGFAAAASLAGAASLTVDGDSSAVKAAFRDGAFDFVVNTLDEALRTIKNELRQRRSIAIGLILSPAAFRTEAEERGLQPDFIALPDSGDDSKEVRAWLLQRNWKATEVEMRTVAPDSVTETCRLNWLQNLPAHQRSARGPTRWAWATV